MTFSPDKSHAEAAADVGIRESGSNCQGYSQWQYGVHCPRGGWCMSAASKWAFDGGFRWGSDATCGDKGFYNTDSCIAWARAHGLLRDPDTYRGKRGDLAIWNWDGSGLTGTDHVGQLDTDDGRRTVTIEGNTSDQVAWRTRDRGDLVAIIALTASPQVQHAPDPEVLAALVKLDHLQKRVDRDPLVFGDHGDDVQFFNELGARAGLRAWFPDMSHFGPGTRDLAWLCKKIMRAQGLLEPHEKSGKRIGRAVVDWLVTQQ